MIRLLKGEQLQCAGTCFYNKLLCPFSLCQKYLGYLVVQYVLNIIHIHHGLLQHINMVQCTWLEHEPELLSHMMHKQCAYIFPSSFNIQISCKENLHTPCILTISVFTEKQAGCEIYFTISRTLRKQTTTETVSKFYKVMAVLISP